MQIYLVGGAVRDTLLGLTPKDMDWVVVGASEDQMLQQGFKKVGSDFPVFIHPKTKEEYALARTERKIFKGYNGFETKHSLDITLSQDLARRDLTINSIAMDNTGNIIDPFNGKLDIKNRILRHTTGAFCEDPLRVIRLARFKAQLSDFNFSIADDTKLLTRKIIDSGEMAHLKQERLGVEFCKSLHNPHIFFSTLSELECLNSTFPNINLRKLPYKEFFMSHNYLTASDDSRISTALFQHSVHEIKKLKIELCLSNNIYKQTLALSIIVKISQQNLSAVEILEYIKVSNTLRDSLLLENSIMNIKIIEKLNSAELNIKIDKTLAIIKTLKTTCYKTLITNSKEAKKTVYTAKLDIIKKYFKI